MVKIMASISCRLLAISMILVSMAGCGEDKTRKLEAEVEKSRNAIEALNAEKVHLSEQLGRLQSEYDELQSEYANLRVKEEQLSLWCLQMAEAFGPGVWFIGKDEKPLPQKSIPDATPARLIDELNQLFEKSNLPQVLLVEIKEDTAHVRITDEVQLTQQMGSTGATSYLQAVTYTLTSLPGIDYVDFDFEEGDHAAPGRYSR
jgi:hypothetical protein